MLRTGRGLGWGIAACLLVACAGGGTDGAEGTDGADGTDGTDTDGGSVLDTADGGPDGGFEVFESIEPVAPFVETTFEGLPVFSYVPDTPAGVVFIFHGSGGSGSVVESAEMTAIVNDLIDRDLGFIAATSDNRAAKQWDDGSGPGTNPDFQRLIRIRQQFLDSDIFEEDTPVFGLGFSNGGAFTHYFGHAATAEGWPVAGQAFLCSRGRSSRYGGDTVDVTTLFLPSEHDPRVPLASVEDDYDTHVAAGVDAHWMPAFESDLAPTRFARSPFLTKAISRDNFRVAVEEGYYSAEGERLFGLDDLEGTVDAYVAEEGIRYPKPTTAVMKVVLAMHAIHGLQSADVADRFASAAAAQP